MPVYPTPSGLFITYDCGAIAISDWLNFVDPLHFTIEFQLTGILIRYEEEEFKEEKIEQQEHKTTE